MEQEIKFVLPRHSVTAAVQWLNHVCYPDRNFPQNIVSSLYYDTRDWQFLREKLNSDYLKTKVRVRWYSNDCGKHSSETPFVEVKQKIGAARKKFRTKAPFSSQWLSDADLRDPGLLHISFLLKSRGLLLEHTLFPAFIIQYERARFVDPVHHVRVSVDNQISVPRINSSLLCRRNSFEGSSSSLNMAVLEIKGNVENLSGFLHYITAIGGKKSSFSKYLACYQHITTFQR
jgi:hypothetical protein